MSYTPVGDTDPSLAPPLSRRPGADDTGTLVAGPILTEPPPPGAKTPSSDAACWRPPEPATRYRTSDPGPTSPIPRDVRAPCAPPTRPRRRRRATRGARPRAQQLGGPAGWSSRSRPAGGAPVGERRRAGFQATPGDDRAAKPAEAVADDLICGTARTVERVSRETKRSLGRRFAGGRYKEGSDIVSILYEGIQVTR